MSITTKHFVVTQMDDNIGEVYLFVSHSAKHALKMFDHESNKTCSCIHHEHFVSEMFELEFACVVETDVNDRVQHVTKIDGVQIESCDSRLGEVWFK